MFDMKILYIICIYVYSWNVLFAWILGHSLLSTVGEFDYN